MTRRTELDICRFAACLMVLLIHTGAELYHICPIDTPAFRTLSFMSTLVRGAVPVFFMLTGALVLGRKKLELTKFIKNHVLRLLGLFLLWSLGYAVLSRIVSGSLGQDWYGFVYDVVKGHYHLWFLTAMATCCLFLPVAHRAIHGGGLDIKYLLVLFFLLGLLTANMNLTPDTAPILYQITLNFSLSYLPYLGYAAWGCWLSRRHFGKRWLLICPAVYLAVTVLATWGNIWYSGYKQVADGWLFSYFSLPSFIQASCIFCFFLALGELPLKRSRLWALLSDCTLGVYLVHPAMINLLQRLELNMSTESPVLSLCLFTLVLAVCCFALTAAAKRVPLIKKLL